MEIKNPSLYSNLSHPSLSLFSENIKEDYVRAFIESPKKYDKYRANKILHPSVLIDSDSSSVFSHNENSNENSFHERSYFRLQEAIPSDFNEPGPLPSNFFVDPDPTSVCIENTCYPIPKLNNPRFIENTAIYYYSNCRVITKAQVQSETSKEPNSIVKRRVYKCSPPKSKLTNDLSISKEMFNSESRNTNINRLKTYLLNVKGLNSANNRSMICEEVKGNLISDDSTSISRFKEMVMSFYTHISSSQNEK